MKGLFRYGLVDWVFVKKKKRSPVEDVIDGWVFLSDRSVEDDLDSWVLKCLSRSFSQGWA